MRLAAQLYTLREYTTTPDGFRHVLSRCKQIGYEGVQLSAVGCMSGDHPLVDADTAKNWLDEEGLQCCATHRSWKSLSQDIHKEIEFHKKLGCGYVALGSIGTDFGYDAAAYTRFLEMSKPVGEKLGEAGLKFGYHNHSHEFVTNPFTKRPCIELLTSPAHDWLQMEVDTYWVADAGVCPSDFLDLCKGRIEAVHLKDREVVIGEGPVMAPVGEGTLNWNAILASCRNGGTEWLIVEQDTCRRDPFSCIESSFVYLQSALSAQQ